MMATSEDRGDVRQASLPFTVGAGVTFVPHKRRDVARWPLRKDIDHDVTHHCPPTDVLTCETPSRVQESIDSLVERDMARYAQHAAHVEE